MSQNNQIFVMFSGAAGTQFGRKIYTTTMPFNAAERFLVVFPEVQRKINKTRVKAIAQYILNGLKARNYCFLSAVTATCRGTIGYDEAQHLVSIDINANLSINDGQHRVAGIKMALDIVRKQVEKAGVSELAEAKKRLDRLENMSIPVVIFDNMDKTYEEQLFHDLNLLQSKPTKSVSLKFDNTDLYNTMAKEMKVNQEWLLKYGIDTERTSLSDKNSELMVLSTLRNMISYIISGVEKDKNDMLTLENYDEWYITVSEMFDQLLSVLPEDCSDRTKYILGTAATMQGIGKYMHYLLNNDSIANMNEYIAGLGDIDWRHNNQTLIKGGFGGSYDSAKAKFIFSGTGAGVNGVCNYLINHNRPNEAASA